MHKRPLKDKKVFVLDMDGTFYLGDRLLEGSLEFLSAIRDRGMSFIFFTNNSSKTPGYYIKKLASMDCHIDERQIVTSGMVAISYLKRRFRAPRVYLLGTPLLEEDFVNSGITLTDCDPDAVVAGFDTTLTYEKLDKACALIRKGIPFIATHPDINCPVDNGLMPDCGAICAFITTATGVRPEYLGKPSSETLDFITQYTNTARSDLVFVGDRLETDIAIGFRHEVTTALVLTGVTRLKDLAGSEIKPDIIADRLVDLLGYL
ncbi:MAG TPA: HAD-IIA family hydrolase [Candidatus Atribacteria bacterium]|nr:HAD-IIA family hydrolase [Candidatus Atribacteria bacterium]